MKKFLLLGLCAAALTACQPTNTSTEKSEKQGSSVITAYQLNKDNPMEYAVAGQTDDDHLYLEEV